MGANLLLTVLPAPLEVQLVFVRWMVVQRRPQGVVRSVPPWACHPVRDGFSVVAKFGSLVIQPFTTISNHTQRLKMLWLYMVVGGRCEGVRREEFSRFRKNSG
jgi:hypothetical protein